MRFAELAPEPVAWMNGVGDAVLVGDALRAVDPDLRERLVSCRPKRFRLGNGGSFKGSYVLRLRGNGGDDEEVTLDATVRAPGTTTQAVPTGRPFGHPDWAVRVDPLSLELRPVPTDSALGSYDDLVDPSRAPQVLTEVLATGSRRGVVVTRAATEVLRHKPGSRCTFRMTVEVDGPGAEAFPSTLITKIHAGDKGEVADRSMRALWSSPMRSASVRIAEPLGFDPVRKILLQGPLPEAETFRDVLKGWFAGGGDTTWDRLTDLARRTGVGLGALHTCGVPTGESVGVADELAEVDSRASRVVAAFPGHAPMMAALTGMLHDLAASSEPEPSRPAHRSFRPAQVLLAGPDMGFIDFDGFCQAEPAMDVALFCTMLRSIGLNKGIDDKDLSAMPPGSRDARLDEADRLCDAFLEGYGTVASVDPRRLALWETVHVAGVVVASWTKLKLARLPNALHLLDVQLDRSGVRRVV